MFLFGLRDASLGPTPSTLLSFAAEVPSTCRTDCHTLYFCCSGQTCHFRCRVRFGPVQDVCIFMYVLFMPGKILRHVCIGRSRYLCFSTANTTGHRRSMLEDSSPGGWGVGHGIQTSDLRIPHADMLLTKPTSLDSECW